MKTLVVLLMLSLMAVSAFAVVDPDPDMMGIYFDETADVNCFAPIFRERWFGYLILTNPTYPAVDAYEFSFTYAITGGLDDDFIIRADNIANGVVAGVRVGVDADYAVGLSEPIPASPATILHSWEFQTFDELMTVELFLGALSEPSIPGAALPIVKLAGENTLMTTGISTGGVLNPVAVVKPDCTGGGPVATESDTWGGVKSLYR